MFWTDDSSLEKIAPRVSVTIGLGYMKRAHSDVIGIDNDDCKIIEKLSPPIKRPCLTPIGTNQLRVPDRSGAIKIKEFRTIWTLGEISALLTACLTHKSGKLESFNDWYQVWVRIVWPELPRTIDACRYKIADIVTHIGNWSLLSKVNPQIVEMIKRHSGEFERIFGCKIATELSSPSNSLPTNAMPTALIVLQQKMAFIQKIANQTPSFPFGVFKLPNCETYKTKTPTILWQEACKKDAHFLADYIAELDRVMRLSPETRIEMVADQVYGHIDDWFGEMLLCKTHDDVVKTIEHYSLVWVWLNLLRALLRVKFGVAFEAFFSPFK
jgi:hypothetical protein